MRNPSADIYIEAVDYEFYNTGGISAEPRGQQRQPISELQVDKFFNPQSFLVWKIRFKTQVTTCFDFSSDALLWIKEVEMVASLDELKSS